MVLRSRYFLNRRLSTTPYIDRSRRLRSVHNTLRRTDTNPEYLETIIIHSDSEEEESRIKDEISRLRNRMDELDDEKNTLKVDMAKKYRELESIRIARFIRNNNIRLRREFETRLIPTIESIATRREEIRNGVRALFDEIDNYPNELPPSYESLFSSRQTTSTSSGTRISGTTASTSNPHQSDSDDSSTSLPSVETIFNRFVNDESTTTNNTTTNTTNNN